MRKVGLLFCLVSMLSVAAGAQRKWSVGAKAGISIPNLRAPKDDIGFNGGYKSVIGPVAGLLLEYKLSKNFSLQTQLNYSTQGGEKKGDQRIRTKGFESFFPAGTAIPDYLFARFDNKIKLVYIELPLLAKYNLHLSKFTELSFLGGPYVGQLVKATNISTGRSKIYTDPNYTQEFNSFTFDFNREEDVIDQFYRLNYGVQGGMIISYAFKPVKLFIAGEGTYGLRYLQKDERFGKNQTGGATVSGGVMVRL
jgi:hypothetical protein